MPKSPVKGRPRIEWNQEMDAAIGAMSDAAFSKKFNVSLPTVAARRRALGKDIFPSKKGKVHWTAEMDAAVEGGSDLSIAKKLGLSVLAVAQRRCILLRRELDKHLALSASVDPSLLILPAPSFMSIKKAREDAGLTLKQAAALAGSPSPRAWLRYESAERQMGVDRWALFLLALGQHPHYSLISR